MIRLRSSLFALAAIACGFSSLASAAPSSTLRVITKPIEPFAFKADGKDTGFSLELWARVAQEMGVKYEVTWVKTVPELIDALAANKADVAVAAISITSEREKRIDFSQPYYESGLQIMVGPGSGNTSSYPLLTNLMTWDFAKLLGMLALALLVSSHVLWWFEHRNNPESFPSSYRHGVWESLWWTSSVLITGGCENKAPTGVGGRLVAIIWMLTGILLVSYITGSVTSAMTVRSLTTGINGPNDLPGQVVATVAGSTAERYLNDRKLEVRSFPSLDEAANALTAGNAKAVVYDAPVLLYRALKGTSGGAHVVGHVFEKQNYGIALQQDSTYRKQVNEILLRLSEEGVIADLRRKYFGSEE
ncbi:MAG: transporter substrate-binding domain-containing protein [Deltaproteobacteria bacterium]|nr:transporter substrate-binding domain-containing protein [Deltaproteobacteria bacterium]